LSLQLELICRRPRQETKAIPLLFVHGAFCGAWVWDEHFLPFFAAQGYTAYALSLRGHGASEGHEQLQEASLKDYVDDVGEVIARLDRVPALIGHSLGGVVVQSYLRHHAIPGAVLMASGPPHGMLPCAVGMALRNPMLFRELYLTQFVGAQGTSGTAIQAALFSQTVPMHDVRRYFACTQSESVRLSFDLMFPQFPRRQVQRDTPVLVMGAARDDFVSPVMVRATARVYGTKAEIIPGMAHAMMLETNWIQGARRIAGWLEQSVTVSTGEPYPAAS
jgi:pimeloyl-ACP methyl ester carboxylesterase